ncbi:hypothetical protein B0H13DRAFT_2374283 [Mycena leptocephala]|nr:hypothetical protein B0H13DRAFT_2374283 [Mycena leptocephala]
MAIQDPGFSLLSSVTFPKNRLEILNATSNYASMPPQCHLKSLFRATSQVSQGPCNIYSKLSSSIRQMCQAYGSVLGVANVMPSSQVTLLSLLPSQVIDAFPFLGFLLYCFTVLIFSLIMAYGVAVRHGRTNPLMYISIASFVGGVSGIHPSIVWSRNHMHTGLYHFAN